MAKFAVISILVPLDDKTPEIVGLWFDDLPENAQYAADKVDIASVDDVSQALRGTAVAHARRIQLDGRP